MNKKFEVHIMLKSGREILVYDKPLDEAKLVVSRIQELINTGATGTYEFDSALYLDDKPIGYVKEFVVLSEVAGAVIGFPDDEEKSEE